MNVKFVNEPCLEFEAGLGNTIHKVFTGDVVTITKVDNSPNSLGEAILAGKLESINKKEIGLVVVGQDSVTKVALKDITNILKC